jgi:catechol-2,3-dioxygenase
MPKLGSVAAITIDCSDPASLANFYQQITGFEVVWSDEKTTYLAGDGPVRIGFQKVENYKAPEWPEQSVPQQMHLDFSVEDLDRTEQQLLALGATKPSFQAGGERWRTLLDPAGHPFDITTVA